MLNKIVLMGRLTADPELKYTQSNLPVTSFSLAVDRNYSPQGNEAQTDFFRCVAWRHTAEFITKYFRKGKLMALEGEMQSREWEDSNGKKQTRWEVVISNVFFCGDKSESSNDTAEIPSWETVGNAEDDDLPF